MCESFVVSQKKKKLPIPMVKFYLCKQSKKNVVLNILQ